LHSLQKTGTDEEFGEFKLNMVEIATRWDQSSTNPRLRAEANAKAQQLERDGKKVRDDSMRGLVKKRDEKVSTSHHPRKNSYSSDTSESTITIASSSKNLKKAPKNAAAKRIDEFLDFVMDNIENGKRKFEQLKEKENRRHGELVVGLKRLSEEMERDLEERRQQAEADRQARREELYSLVNAFTSFEKKMKSNQ
jgi:hypothetical protein